MNPAFSTPAAPRVLLVCPEHPGGREAALARGLAAHAQLTVAVPTPAARGAQPDDLYIVVLDDLGSIPPDQTPEFIVFASPPPPGALWKTWRWKRFHAAGALWGGYVTPPGGEPGRVAALAARLAWGAMDFFLAEGEDGAARLQRAGAHPRRVVATGGDASAPARIVAFLAQRRAAEERSLLWVDEDISLHSPSTKHLVYSLPHLREEGWEVRAWCLSTDVPGEAMETRRFPALPGRLGFLTPYWFTVRADAHGLWRWMLDGHPSARVVHTVGGAFHGADLASIQFVNHVWLRKQLELGVGSFKKLLMFAWTLLGTLKDQLQFSNPRCRVFLPASDSIAAEVRRRCLARARVETLPNSYDETRFNPAVRRQWREPMRRELGFGEGDTVFCFASQGHHERKGFWLAVEALARLRRRDEEKARAVRFLVIGGQPATVARLQAALAASHPDWSGWLVFVGNQREVEKYLAAADAFLFPSYFEAFCLAEIEAGALGVPLLLTPHHGTEMILRPGENGLLLPFDAPGIEQALAGFLEGGLPPFEPGAGRALDRAAYARELARVYREFPGTVPDAPHA